jgi:crossover junction endodeoxyribonuclease RuvC
MIILGFDPALRVTGYGAIQTGRGGLQVIEAGIISTSSKDSLPRRLEVIYKVVSKLISDVRPDCLVLEKLYAHYRHPATAFLLGEARGVICLASAVKKVPLFEYAATRVKKAIIGKGLASKIQVQKMVASHLNISVAPKYTDVTDALALAICHSNIIKGRVSQ